MKNPEIKILLLVNRESLLTNGILSNESIVDAIMSSVHRIVGTSINAIGIYESYHYNSFSPFLSHLSQIMGAHEIDVRSDGAITRYFKTYIVCRGYPKEFYTTFSFSQVESIDDFKKGAQLNLLVNILNWVCGLITLVMISKLSWRHLACVIK